MNEKNRKICRLCLKTICNGDFDTIDKIARHMLKTLLLDLVLDISKEPMMCSDCAANLQKAFDFKLSCLKTENRLQPFTISEVNAKLNLIEIYLKENKIIDMLDDQRVCRICIELIERGYFFNLHITKEDIFIVNILQKHIPELDLTITEDPVVCNTCRQSLGNFNSFIKHCLIVEKTIIRHVDISGADDMGQIDLSNIQHLTLKSQLMDTNSKGMRYLKLENTYDESVKTEIKYESDMEVSDSKLTVSYEEIENTSYQNSERNKKPKLGDKTVKNTADTDFGTDTVVPDVQQIEICRNTDTKHDMGCQTDSLQESLPETNVKTEYKCTECTFETKYRNNLTTHLLIDENSLKLTMHKCLLCTYEAKYRRDIKRHNMEAHKEATEVMLRQCAKYEPNFNLHELLQKETSEVVMLRCHNCLFETKYKRNLKRHMKMHRKLIKYECKSCTFKTNNKVDLRKHMTYHKNSLEVYKCETCTCETNDKCVFDHHMLVHKHTSEDALVIPKINSSKTKHMIVHKNSSKIKMHVCEICSYQSKRKDIVERHKLTHKESSEVIMYRCEICLLETKYKSVLKRHRLTHQSSEFDIRMFKCDKCSYESKYKADVKKHVLIHKKPSEIMMYKCQICEYETKYKTAYNRHMLIHRDPSEVTLYECEICLHKTKYKSSIETHMLTHNR